MVEKKFPNNMSTSSQNGGELAELPPSETSCLLNDDKTANSRDLSNGGQHKERKRFQTTAALSFTLLIQSYLLVSVLPYSGFLAMHLIPGLNEETAGSYAGYIASSFMIGRAFSSFEWGKAADRYGRVFVIKLSLLLSALFSILFGLSSNFYMALILRSLLGVSNGLIGPIKTMIPEYARGDLAMETKMMATVMGTWGWGFLMNPAIAGFLSDPVKQYPDEVLVKFFHPILEKYPFFLPNFVGFLFCLVGYVVVHCFVEETLPEGKRQEFRLDSIFPCIKTNAVMRNVSSWGLFKHLHNEEGGVSEDLTMMISPSEDKEGFNRTNCDEEPATIQSLMKRRGTREHLMVYWFYSFLSITVDEIFPLYCISKTSGLGITEKSIGKILSGTGVCYVIIQYFLLTGLVDRFGFYKTLRIGTIFSMPAVCLIPASLITNKNAPEGTLALPTLVYLSVVVAIVRSLASVAFSCITMTANRTVSAHQRSTMNGLSMLGGSFAKAGGPMFGGILFSSSVNHITPPFGSVFVYSFVALLGVCLATQACLLREYVPQEKSSAATKEAEGEEGPPTF